jgi:hypothetical protein
MNDTKATTLDGCWEKLWSQAVSDFWGFVKQQDNIRNSLALDSKFQEEDSRLAEG